MTKDQSLADLRAAIAEAESRRSEVARSLRTRRVELPLRYWRQEAHFTTPASDRSMARKAVEGGTTPVEKILERVGVTTSELADRLRVKKDAVEDLVRNPRRAPLVMLDGEDAVALREDVVAEGLDNAVDILCTANWQPAASYRSLRFFRPPGFNLGGSIRDLYALIWALVDRSGPEAFPLDGIVFPKIEHPEEVDLLNEILGRAEQAVGLPLGSIRVSLLIESCWAVLQLPEIASRAAPRLVSLVFGLADYSADLGVRSIEPAGTLVDWARAEIINTAAALGVPAIDAMTLDYPVSDPTLNVDSNRRRFLDRVALVFSDASHAAATGMLGKWVGHPVQLFAVLLAYDQAYAPASLEHEVSKLEAYATTVRDEAKGATIISGVMSDRATDRHARVVLRRATAMGRFDPRRAHALGVVTADELATLAEETGGSSGR